MSPGGMKVRLRGVSRRFGWGLADQAVSSLTNFAVSLYVAHSLGLVQFGAFSLAYATYGFALNASRGLATDPLMVRFSGTSVPIWRRAVRRPSLLTAAGQGKERSGWAFLMIFTTSSGSSVTWRRSSSSG